MQLKNVKNSSNTIQFIARYRSLLIIGVGGVFILVGILLLQTPALTNKNIPTSEQTNVEVVTDSNDEPSEEKPDNCESYRSQDYPFELEIDSIDLKSCIQQVGRDQEQRIATPNNVHVAGWYVHGAQPGQKGITILDGHVSGRYSDGVFKNIHKLQPGAVIHITLSDGTVTTYQVATVREYSESDTLIEQYKPLPDVSHQLNLITCGGAFNGDTNSYPNRTLVRAALVQ